MNMDRRGIMEHRPNPKAYVETYGCQMNISDSELM
jgi:hypothetical protein